MDYEAIRLLETTQQPETASIGCCELDIPLNGGIHTGHHLNPGEEAETPVFRTFSNYPSLDVVAVDTGVIRLGETRDGLIMEIKGTIIHDSTSQITGYLAQTGPIFLSPDRVELHHRISADLQKPDIFTKMNQENKPTGTKSGAPETVNQYADRLRNWFERQLQLTAAGLLRNGILLIVGVLTRDT
jgi:hypothetical protein